MDVERHNLTQIAQLNQRGGRTLSVVDLMEDGTISAEMAGLCWLAVASGAGFITGAVPGGAGKTTLMATLLSFLPPGERIVTVGQPRVIGDAQNGTLPAPLTVMAHEIGSGHWFGYIWGRDVADFFSLWRRGIRCVSCLHADTPDQTKDALHSLGVTDVDLGHIRLQLFMSVRGGLRRPVRRVSGLYAFLDRGLRLIYRWEESEDRFERMVGRDELCSLLAVEYGSLAGDLEARWTAYEGCLAGLRREGVRSFDQVRSRIVQCYDAQRAP